MKSSPPSRSSKPRPASPSAPPVSAGAPPSAPPKSKRSSSKKSAPAAPLSANERGIQRRAKKKAQGRRRNVGAIIALVAATTIIVGAAAGIRSELKSTKSHVAAKQITLAALQAQLDQGKKRLAAFTKGTGRERALAENGYIRPGERILLFPKKK